MYLDLFIVDLGYLLKFLLLKDRHLVVDTYQNGDHEFNVHLRVQEGIQALFWVLDCLAGSCVSPEELIASTSFYLLENIGLACSQEHNRNHWEHKDQDLAYVELVYGFYEVIIFLVFLILGSLFVLFVKSIYDFCMV